MAEEESTPKFLDLPIDILLLIFPYLDAPSFLSLTATCRALHSTEILHDNPYWSHLVRRDFRVPNQPVVQNDGQRWQKLYKRLRTQARIFTWGNNEKGCLGHSFETPMSVAAGRGARRGRRRHVNWPVEMQGITKEMRVISDIQCGGWSTTTLTSNGALYMVGVMDGMFVDRRVAPYFQQVKVQPAALKFPRGYPRAGERYEPTTAIRQFSSGRAHILALSDSGRTWSWHNADLPGTHVKFVHHEVKENGRESGRGVVRKVVAGWNKSAAYIEGSGIVVWEPLQMSQEESDATDTALVLETAVVPGTDFVTPKHSNVPDTDADIGEVQSFIVLEAAIIFNTSLGKVFAAQITWDDEQQVVKDPVKLRVPDKEVDSADTFVTDVQGSFQNFAIFTKSGAVLTSNLDTLMPQLQRGSLQPALTGLFKRIPALQNKQVISLAFGDYHFHALHAPGYITSYGYEPQGCGALGLGGNATPENRLRGIRNQGIGGDGHLVPHAYTEGRQVWFEEEKRQWVRFMTSGGVDQAEAAERIRLAIGSPDVAAQGEVSEWIEQQGRDWVAKFGIGHKTAEDDGLGAYFALSVTAAGWHSGAIVLVNEVMAEKLSRAVEVSEAPSNATNIEDLPVGEEEPSIPLPPQVEPLETAPADTSFLGQALDWGRYLLGLPPYNVSDTSYDPNLAYGRANRALPRNATASAHQLLEPINYGASPRYGFKYVWAEDHFPRLKLSNGTELPGTVDFDEWRYGRPEWKLDWENESAIGS